MTEKARTSKPDLRTMLIIVCLITSMSMIYQRIAVQVGALVMTIVLLAIHSGGGSNLMRLRKRLSRIGRIIAILFVVQLLLRRTGDPIWQWSFVVITDTGLEYALVVSLRLILIILVAGLLFDYPFTDYLRAFRAWRIPYEISFLIANTIHFIPVFRRQAIQMKEALQIRGIQLGTIPLRRRGKALASLALPIVAGILNDVKYRAISLEMRGFRYRDTRTDFLKSKLTPADLSIQVIGFMIFGALLFLLKT